MKTSLLIIVLFVLASLANAMQPSTLSQVKSSYNGEILPPLGGSASRLTDSTELVALYNSTNGAGWINKNNWFTANPINTWNGITLLSSRVDNINLSSNNLVGTIPSSISNLTSIQIINLQNNQLSGAIPTSLLTLYFFYYLDVSQNHYTFKNLEPIVALVDPLNFYFSYANQANVGIVDTLYRNTKQLIELSIKDYLPGNYDQFQWFQNSNLLPGKTNDTLLISSAALTDDGSYYCRITNTLCVDDTLESENIRVYVTANTPPVSNAGRNQSVKEGLLVNLDGSGSYDPDSDPITYLWSPPAGISLSSLTDSIPTFTAPEVTKDTTYTFSLVVSDSLDNSALDTVLITIVNYVTVPETLGVADTIVGSYVACFDALQIITLAANGNPVIFENGSTVDLIAGQNVRFLPGFHANSGSHVIAKISTNFCTPPDDQVQPVITEKGVLIDPEVMEKSPVGVEKSFKVYPNPSNGKVTVELMNYDRPAQINIYNTLGSKVYYTTVVSSVELNLSQIAKGLYVVQVASDETIQTRKVLIN